MSKRLYGGQGSANVQRDGADAPFRGSVLSDGFVSGAKRSPVDRSFGQYAKGLKEDQHGRRWRNRMFVRFLNTYIKGPAGGGVHHKDNYPSMPPRAY